MYFYHGHASALGGTFIRPFQKTIEPQAAVSLPITGGSGVSRIENYSFEGLISFKMAQADVGGGIEKDKGNHVHSTRVSVVIEGLNILNMITAERIVARLASEHTTADAKGKVIPDSEPGIIAVGSHFDDLKIAGHKVDVSMDHKLFCDFDTYTKCQAGYASAEGKKRLLTSMVGSRMKEKDMEPTDKSPQHLQDIHTGFQEQSGSDVLKKTVVCSFVTGVGGLEGPEIKSCGPIVVVPQFGTIYLGELIISHGMRRISMLRVELGSPDGGSFGVGTGTSNGTGYP